MPVMRVGAIIVALMLCAAAPARAQAASSAAEDDDRCLDAKGHDRCADAIAELFVKDYGLPAGETLSGGADLTVRISEYMFNTLEPALVFTIRRGERARVEVLPPRNRARLEGPA